ncbi:MAG: histidine phosphatase family protein [Spirochaetaceae bacterium]|nr:histidine phosphatase family protein [Spirochaetaceae bacterium]
MSRTLYLLRHAKAGSAAAGRRDHDRELTVRGRREAAALGARYAGGGDLPDLVVTSTAARAVQTAELWAQAAGLPATVIVRRDGIYLAEAEAVLRLVHGLDEALQRVLLVGHNPTFSELATGLSRRFIALPTCAMAVLSVVGAWADAGAASARLLRIDRGR